MLGSFTVSLPVVGKELKFFSERDRADFFAIGVTDLVGLLCKKVFFIRETKKDNAFLILPVVFSSLIAATT